MEMFRALVGSGLMISVSLAMNQAKNGSVAFYFCSMSVDYKILSDI